MSNISGAGQQDESATDSALIDSDHVQDTNVFDPAGKHIGTVRRLVIDKLSGQVVYTVAQFGGFLGLGGKEYTIPWQTLSYDTSLGGFRTDITEEQLKHAPSFGNGSGEGYDNRASERELNAYYGSRNYWE